MDNNHLTTLPESIGNLLSLEELHCAQKND